MSKVGNLNKEAYGMMFNLENLLRIKIDEVLNIIYNSNYFIKGKYILKINKNKRDLFDSASKRKQLEVLDKVPNSNNTPLIYYIDFGNLAFIMSIEWEHLKGNFSGKWDMDKIKQVLSSLESIRNRIAHNRPIREIEFQEIKVAYDYFLRYLENLSIDDILSNPISNNINVSLIKKKLNKILINIKNRDIVDDDWLNVLENGKKLLLSSPQVVKNIDELIKLFTKYTKIPRITGSYLRINKYVNENKVEEKLNFILNNLY
jgi:hypothetical protein